MAGVHLGAAVTCDGIWWWLDSQVTDEEPPNFNGACIVPGVYVDEDGDACDWEVGMYTCWTDYDVERDEATVVPVDEWPDEVCAAVALYRLGIEGGE